MGYRWLADRLLYQGAGGGIDCLGVDAIGEGTDDLAIRLELAQSHRVGMARTTCSTRVRAAASIVSALMRSAKARTTSP